MDRLEQSCAVPATLSLAGLLAPTFRAVKLGSEPTLVVERVENGGQAYLRHVLALGLFRRSWDALVQEETATRLVAEGAEGFESFRHELVLEHGTFRSVMDWRGSTMAAALPRAVLSMPEHARLEPSSERPTTRIVLNSESAAA
jgi:hypothetical protein